MLDVKQLVTIELLGAFLHSFLSVRIAYFVLQDTISFKYHWGKVILINKEWVERSYGSNLNDWKVQRARLLTTTEMQKMFSSDFTDSIGVT
jgi:hypothetical protein